jgi:hypothetical protein
MMKSTRDALQDNHWWQSTLVWFALTLAAIAAFTAVGPAERTLGSNARVVYLHGVWVWAALAAFLAAALAGLAGLITQNQRLHHWSRALGRTGLLFWITYIPISIWAMQTNWNGLFLAEPRFRLAVIFSLGGLMLQVGVTLLGDAAWASASNLVYFLALLYALGTTQNVMHPPAPILNSDAWRIQVFFGGLLILTLLAAWQIARWWYQLEKLPGEVLAGDLKNSFER